MTKKLHIIASCTDRKRALAPREARLRNFSEASVEQRALAWSRALHDSNEARVAAVDLYCGHHWSVVRELPALAESKGWKAQLWIASAGYGLVPSTALLVPYAATFTAGQPDSVASGRNVGATAPRWWSELSKHRGPDSAAPRSVRALVHADPSATIVVIASSPYLRAMDADLDAARTSLTKVGQLLLVSSAPGPVRQSLKEHWIESSSKLQREVGGSLMALHARVARKIIDSVPAESFRVHELRDRYAGLVAAIPETNRLNRVLASDLEVETFIQQVLLETPKAAHTPTLRLFRASGRACEQGRFRELFMKNLRGLA